MKDIFHKLDQGIALTHQEAEQAAAYFYRRLHYSREHASDFTILQNYLAIPFTPEHYGGGKAIAIFFTLSQEELVPLFEKYHALKANRDVMEPALRKDPELEAFILHHADKIDITSDKTMKNSVLAIAKEFFRDEQNLIDRANGSLPIETVEKLVLHAQGVGKNILHITQDQAMALLNQYPADAAATLSGEKKRSFNAFMLTHLSFPREMYDFTRDVIDKTLTDLTKKRYFTLMSKEWKPTPQGGTLKDVYTHFETMTQTEKRDYLQAIANVFCKHAGIPHANISIDNELTDAFGMHTSPDQISINLDLIAARYENGEIVEKGDKPVLEQTLLLDTIFHELKHHMTVSWQAIPPAELAKEPLFKQKTVAVLNACGKYKDRNQELHDYRPTEKIANLVGSGYVAPRVLFLLEPEKAERLKHLVDLHTTDDKVHKQYYQEFDASGLGDGLFSPTTPATNAKRSKIIAK